MPASDPNDLLSELPSAGGLPKCALVASFVLSLLGGLLFLFWTAFMISVFFFVTAACLAYPSAKAEAPPHIRRVARVALGAALAGCAGYLLWVALLPLEVGTGVLKVGVLALLIPLLVNVLRTR